MAKLYTEELVFATTDDDVLLAGVAIQPTDVPAKPVALVWIHGNAAAFSDRPYVLIGRALATLGYPVIIGNTRGHDIAAILWRASDDSPSAGGGGAGWERMEDAPRDLVAWVTVAEQMASAGQATGGVALIGHSKGAQKVLRYAAERPSSHLVGVALSSPDLRGLRMPGELEAARQLVAEGRGMEVLPATPWAPWYRQSAQTVVSHAETAARLFTAGDGSQPTLARIAVPILALFGGQEQSGEADLTLIRAAATGAPRVETHLIADAGHFYTGHETEVARVIAGWADGLHEA